MLMHLLLVALPAVVLSTAPSFSVAPDPPVIGQQAVFTCQSGGSTYKIIKDGAEVVATETHTITTFDLSDAGTWKCNADVGGGSTDSLDKVVPSTAVNTPELELDPVTPVEGSDLTLTCHSIDAESYTWKKDGSAFTTNTGVLTLKIYGSTITATAGIIKWDEYAEATNNGTYQCQANKANSLSRVIEMSVTCDLCLSTALASQCTDSIQASAGQAQFSLLILSLGMLLAKSVY